MSERSELTDVLVSERSELTDVLVSERSALTDAPVSEAVAVAVLRVVRGEPTDEELAALLAVVLSRSSPPSAHHARAGWSDRGSRLRRELRSGPGGWRTSAWL